MRRLVASLALAVVIAAALPLHASASAAALKDMTGHWARVQVESGVGAGYVAGYPDGTFRPNNLITRAEFIKLLGAAMRLTPQPLDTGFAEDQSGHWAFTQGHIGAAVGAGLLVPPDYGAAYSPDTQITRQEIVIAAVRALGKGAQADQETRTITAPDADTYPPSLRNWAAIAITDGIITGYEDGSLRLGRTATRAEALVMVQRVLNKVMADVLPTTAPPAGKAARHPGEGEPTWTWTQPQSSGGAVTVSNGTAGQGHTFAAGVTDVAVLPAPGKAAWIRYRTGGDGVIARLWQGRLAEVARFPGKLPAALAVDDAGSLWYTDGDAGLLMAGPGRTPESVSDVTEPILFGAVDWNGLFWGISASRMYRVAQDLEVMPYPLEVAPGQSVRHMELTDDGQLWLLLAGGNGTAKAEAVQVEFGKAIRRIPLLNAYAGGLRGQARIEVLGRSGPYLWVASLISSEAGAAERQEGVYRLHLGSGDFTRLVVPSTVPAGTTAVSAPDGGALLRSSAGDFWRILP